MSRLIYIDTSTFIRSALRQDTTGAATRQQDIVRSEGAELISSQLLELEARRAQIRMRRNWAEVSQALGAVQLVEVEKADFTLAFNIDAPIKSLDALHLASCMKVGADALITADKNMRQVAVHLGIDVRWAG